MCEATSIPPVRVPFVTASGGRGNDARFFECDSPVGAMEQHCLDRSRADVQSQ